MAYYVFSETAKTMKSKNARYYLIGLLAASIMANLAMIAFRDMIYGTNDGTYGYNIIMFAGGFFWVPYYSCIFIADMVFGHDYPDPYIRDKTTRGLKRHDLFFGKLIAEWLMLLMFVTAGFIIFVAVSVVFQLSAGPIENEIIMEFGQNLLAALPLFMAGVAIANMFLFLFKKKLRAFLTYAAAVIAVPRVIMMLGASPFNIPVFRMLKDTLLLTPQFTALQFYATRDVPKIIISSVIYTIIACVIGCISFSRKVIDV